MCKKKKIPHFYNNSVFVGTLEMSCTIQNSGNVSIASSLPDSEEIRLCDLCLINPVVFNEHVPIQTPPTAGTSASC